MKKVCCDCCKKREAYRPVIRTSEGLTLYVCRDCWRRYDYREFFAGAR